MTTITIKPHMKCSKSKFRTFTEAEFDTYRAKAADPAGDQDDRNLDEADKSIHHEIITGRCRPYFDFEKDFDDEETMHKHHYSLLKEAHDDIKRLFRSKKTDKRVAEIVWGDSTGFAVSKQKWRVSARFFVRGAGYFRKPEHMKAVAEKLSVDGFDMGVYHTDKTMRNFYCHKEGEDRPLRRAVFEAKKIRVYENEADAVELCGETWRDWLVTDIWQKDGKEPKCLSPEEESDDESESDDDAEQEPFKGKAPKKTEIRAVLKRLADARACNRDFRRPVVTVLGRIAERLDIDLREVAHEFGTRAGDNYDADKVDAAYDNPDRSIKSTWHTLQRWADEDSGAVHVVADEAPKPTFYNDVRTLLQKRDATIDEVKVWMRGCLARVSNNGNSVFFSRGDDEWTLLLAHPFATRGESYMLSVPNPAHDPKKKKSGPPTLEVKYSAIFDELQSDPVWLRYCCFDRVNFKPFVGEKSPYSPRMFNLFKPLRFQKLTDFKPSGICDRLVKHIKIVLAAGDDDHFEYIMDWIAQIFQQPENKIGICLIFRSKQRAGKNTVFDFIRRKMLPGYSHELTDMDQLTQKHNSHRMNSIFTVLNEVQNYGGAYKSNDKLKSIITDPQIFIEPKGREGFYIDDVCRYVMLTNNPWPAKKTEDDGRLVPFDCSNEKCGDHDYFKQLHDSLTDECAEEFYQILMARDLSRRNFRKLPQTRFGAELIANSVATPIKFMVDVAERSIVLEEEDAELRLPRDTLYESYTRWAKSGNFHMASRDDFVRELAKLGMVMKTVRFGKVQSRGLLLTVDELRACLRTNPAYADHEFE